MENYARHCHSLICRVHTKLYKIIKPLGSSHYTEFPDAQQSRICQECRACTCSRKQSVELHSLHQHVGMRSLVEAHAIDAHTVLIILREQLSLALSLSSSIFMHISFLYPVRQFFSFSICVRAADFSTRSSVSSCFAIYIYTTTQHIAVPVERNSIRR